MGRDKQTDNTMTKWEGTKRQTMIYKTLNRKLKIEPDEVHKNWFEYKFSGSSCFDIGVYCVTQCQVTSYLR
jgi:hypothetical protein